MNFDWDTWSALARDDPEAFERRRVEAVEELIGSAPPEMQQRLRGLQFRIDMERQRSSTPMGACVRINRMMWESFGELRDSLDTLRQEIAGTRGIAGMRQHIARAATATQDAKVLPFPQPR
ncbi:MAG: DUF3135 domain-containing protein [Betaproteobacteria bacterium]|jgi:hypothetical protein